MGVWRWKLDLKVCGILSIRNVICNHLASTLSVNLGAQHGW